MPDLKHSDLMQELKLRQEEIKTTTINISGSRNLSSSTLTKPPKRKIVADHGAGGSGSGGVSEIKSFSSRFVSQTKPHPAGSGPSRKVVRRKKSGLVDDHFEAIVPAVSEEPSPPPCNCPRHFLEKEEVAKSMEKSIVGHLESSRLRLKTTESRPNLGGTWTRRLERFGLHDESRSDSNNQKINPMKTAFCEAPAALGGGHNNNNNNNRDEQNSSSPVSWFTPEMRRAKTDLSEADLKRHHLPIFEKSHSARFWLDKSNSLDALDRVGSESPRNNNRRHYVNVAPPRPPKHGNNAIKIEARRSNPVYVNVYSLGRRKPGDIVQTGRNPAIQIIGNRNERERGVGTKSSMSSSSSSMVAKTTTLSTTTAHTPTTPNSTHRPGLATPSVGARNKVVSVNEKPEPHQPSLSTAAAPTLSQNPKEEASSRLEALLRCTSQFSVSNQHDLNRPPVEVALTSLRSNQTTSNQGQKNSLICCSTTAKASADCCQSFEAGDPAASFIEEGISPNSQQDFTAESADDTASGKRYRSSIRIMVRPEAVTSLQKPIRANSSDGLSRSSSASSGSTSSTAKSAKKMSAAGVRISASRTSEVGQPQRSIVKEQFRLPKDLMEKMPSASNSPMMGRKTSSESSEVKKTQPLSVASMVRRFERDNGLDKNRGGELERSNSSLNKIKSNSPISSRTSSLSSSQGHLASNIEQNTKESVAASVEATSDHHSVSTAEAVVAPAAAPLVAAASATGSTTAKKTTTSNKTVKSGSMSTGIVARAKNALKMDPNDKTPKQSSTGPIHLNTSSNTSVSNKKSSSSLATATSHTSSSRHNTKSSSSSASGAAATVKNGPPSSTSSSSPSATPTATSSASKKPSNSTQVVSSIGGKSKEVSSSGTGTGSSQRNKHTGGSGGGHSRHPHQPHEGQSQSSPITPAAPSVRPSRRITASSQNRVSIQSVAAASASATSASKKSSNSTTSQMGNASSYTKKKSSTPISAASGHHSSRSEESAAAAAATAVVVEKSLTSPKPVVTKESAANKRPSQRPLPTKSSSGSLRTSALKNNDHNNKTTTSEAAVGASIISSRDESPSSTKVNVSSSDDGGSSSVTPPPPSLPNNNPIEPTEVTAAVTSSEDIATKENVAPTTTSVQQPNRRKLSKTEREPATTTTPPSITSSSSSSSSAASTKEVVRRDTRDMVSPISSPNMSDVSDDNDEMDHETSALVKLNNLSSRVKRSESDGIVVTADRQSKTEKPPVRRCESIDDATRDRLGPIEEASEPPLASVPASSSSSSSQFPQNIKTVASATIVKGPEDAIHTRGEVVHFMAHYFGNPEPRVVWIKNGQRLKSSEDGRLHIKTYSGESTLIVRDLRIDDSGKYEIQIENEVGSDAASASLSVEGPPEPPAGRPYVSHIDTETFSLTLAWYGSTFDGGSIVTGYMVEMSSWPITSSSQPPDATDWQILSSDTHLSTSFVVTELCKDKEYIFRVKAVNAHGHSQPSQVSEPVSLSTSNPVSTSGTEEEDEAHGDPSEDGMNQNELDDDPFEAPFEHRIANVEDGSIFKSKYEIYEELGRGRFGVVFKVKDKVTSEILAAKFVRCRKSEEKQKCKDEIAIMNVLDSSKLLQLAAAYENPREIIMVMEYIGGGELFEKVVADDFTLTERDCVLFMRQICEAVGYMHEKYIVHLDLKPENILCKSKDSHLIKVIDFGLTKKLKPGEDVRILFGTPEFVSPEVISYEPVSTTSDMWSVGVICYVLLSGLSPFMGDSDVETFANISGINYDFEDEAFDSISDEAKDFISKLLVKFQNKRLTAAQCLNHPWLLSGMEKSKKEINTEKLKSFLMRRRWQKAAHAIRALGRFTSLGFQHNAKDGASTITALSTQSADF